MYMDEYRTKLYDDNINVMGLSKPTEINYLNYSGKAIDFEGNNDSESNLIVLFQLSQ